MSRLNNSDFNDVIDTITAVHALGPLHGCNLTCGFLCEDIIASLRQVVPDNTMTDDEVCDLLERGTRSGVFRRNNVGSSCPPVPNEESGFCDENVNNTEVVSLFHVNQQMANVNNANKQYADFFNSAAAARFTPLASSGPQCSQGVVCMTDGLFEGGSGTSGTCTGIFTG